MLAGYFEAPEAPPVDDPYRSVVVDVEALRATMPPTVTVSGLVYDVATGLVRKVI